jgi:tetratricopeptide (TPR) repeat protein
VRVLVLTVLLVSGGASASVPPVVELLANECRFAEALEFLDLTTAYRTPDKSRGEARSLRGRLLLQLGRFDEVLASCGAEAVTTGGDALMCALATASLGREEQTSDWAGSARRLDVALADGAEALAAFAAFKFEHAERLLTALVLRDPLSSALYNLACLRSLQGRLEESALLLRRAWAGWRDAKQLRADPELEALRRSELASDLLMHDVAQCLTW